MLSVRPELTWRDVHYIIQRTADRNDLHEVGSVIFPSWSQNAAGVWYSYQYGFGRINAGNAVTLAKTWSLVGAAVGTSSPLITPNIWIPDNSNISTISSYTFTNATDVPTQLEHVMVQFMRDITSINIDLICVYHSYIYLPIIPRQAIYD